MNESVFIKVVSFYQSKKKLALIILSAIFWITAIAYSIYLGDNLRFPDEIKYFHVYGQNIATLNIYSADGINPTAYTPPLYPLIIGFLIMVGSGIIGARLLNFLALFLILIVIYKFLDKQSYKYSPITSVFLIIGYPVLFYTAGTLYPQTIGSLFLLLAVYFYWEPLFSVKKIVLTGIFLGLAILTIPTFVFVLPFMIIFAFLLHKKILTKMVLLAGITILTISPWVIRNYITFDRFVLFSTNFGINFLLGNSPSTEPNIGVLASTGIEKIIIQADIQAFDEFQKNTFFTQSALEFIKKDPRHYAFLYLKKVINYFNFRNVIATKSEGNSFRDILLLITYGFLSCVTLIRIFFLKKFHPSQLELFLLILYVCSAAVSALVFTRIRFRLPFDYLLVIFASIAIDKFITHLVDKKKNNNASQH